ncbi:aldolase [Cryobacterium lactosi]|uniref:Aldolase n=1 Tax=Cryobacterium lactosi TaxID=1259202 RepID=A0A4R9BGL0_9MICO|nr:aldolase/citrate lyase family protein [Cryobacterium lactosi]TFD84016.1 aldolase [Cryobacterium lactosi]
MKTIWEQGGTGIGLWCILRDPIVLEMAGKAGFDYITVDMQHGFTNWATVEGVVRMLRGTPVTTLVRVSANREEFITRALDLGADGVIVPLVETAEQAKRAADACRYPAKADGLLGGNRSFGPLYADLDGAQDSDETNAKVLCVVQIETATALDNLDDIVNTPGIDAIYVGPFDLALSVGLGGRTYRDSDVMRDHIQRVIDVGNAAGIVVGMHCDGPEMAAYWHDHGARMLTTGHDTTTVFSAYKNLEKEARSLIR